MIIGLTGSIGSGKSTATKRLAELGANVLDADVICREKCEPGAEGTLAIKEVFPETVRADGALDRRALAGIVFINASARARLNGILHPMVLDTLFERTGRILEEKPESVVIWDVPLLIECGWQVYCDEVWLVTAERETRIARITARDGCTQEDAARRMDAQMSDGEKAEAATRILANDGTKDEFILLVDGLFASVLGARA